MHGLPLFRARLDRRSLRRFALVCAVASAVLSWGAPQAAQAYSEAIAARPVPGLGLGQAVRRLKSSHTAKLIRLLPGRIRVLVTSMLPGKQAKSRPGVLHEVGPSAESPGAATAAEPSDRKRGARNGKDTRILLVDDDLLLQDLMPKMFKAKFGHETVVAAPGEKKHDVVANEGIALVQGRGKTLSCVVIDGLNGDWQRVADAARKEQVRCCVLSGDGPDRQAEVMAYGIPFFPKPLTGAANWKALGDYIANGLGDQQQPN